jgi:sugar phosphate permease
VGIVLGIVLLIVGLLMLMSSQAPSSFGLGAAAALVGTGALLTALGAASVRRFKDRTPGVSVEEGRAEWRRFFIAATVCAVASFVLLMLNVRVDLMVGLPLAILCMFLFWQFVLRGR